MEGRHARSPNKSLVVDVRFTPASPHDVATGLVGYVRLAYGRIVLDGLTVRRTEGDRIALSWPARRDRRGHNHPFIRPLDDAARVELERAILGELGLGEERP